MAIHHPHSADEHLGFVCESCERIENRLLDIELNLMFIADSIRYAAAVAIEAVEEVAEKAVDEIEEAASDADSDTKDSGSDDDNGDESDSGVDDIRDDEGEGEAESHHEEITPDVPIDTEEHAEPASREHSFIGRQ